MLPIAIRRDAALVRWLHLRAAPRTVVSLVALCGRVARFKSGAASASIPPLLWNLAQDGRGDKRDGRVGHAKLELGGHTFQCHRVRRLPATNLWQ